MNPEQVLAQRLSQRIGELEFIAIRQSVDIEALQAQVGELQGQLATKAEPPVNG